MKVESAKRKLTNIHNHAVFIGDRETVKYCKMMLRKIKKNPTDELLKKVEKIKHEK